MTRAEGLAQLERWFQGAILPTTGRPRTGNVATKLTRSRLLTASQRLAIYTESCFLRLRDCLAADFPAVAHLLGPKAFDRVARAYLAAHPSRHPSLNQLGAAFPDFLEGPVRVARRPLLHDVARLERAMEVVFDAEPAAGLGVAELAAFPRAELPEAVFRFVPAFQLLELEHGASAIVTAARQGQPLPSLAPRRTWVAVYRKDFVVWRKDLTATEHRLLAALRRGIPLARALAACQRAEPDAALDQLVARILGEWRDEGVFARLERKAATGRGSRGTKRARLHTRARS